MMSTRPESSRAIVHLMIELFFAILPLFVLGSVWPSHEQGHPASFWHGPEWSMTACVLYGLALARMQQGMLMSMRKAQSGQHHVAAMFVVISIIPISGVIMSIILITKLSGFSESALTIMGQYVNLLISVVVFVMLGGYGIDRSEN